MPTNKEVKTIEVPFKSDEIDGEFHTMDLKGLKPLNIKYGRRSGNITVICEEVVEKVKKK